MRCIEGNMEKVGGREEADVKDKDGGGRNLWT